MSQDALLFTEDINKARQEIVGLKGRITQQFTDSVFVASLPDSVDPQSLTESTPDQPGTLDSISQLAIDAWKSSQEKSLAASPSETEGLSWDTPGYEPPAHPEDEEPDDSPVAFSGGPLRSSGRRQASTWANDLNFEIHSDNTVN